MTTAEEEVEILCPRLPYDGDYTALDEMQYDVPRLLCTLIRSCRHPLMDEGLSWCTAHSLRGELKVSDSGRTNHTVVLPAPNLVDRGLFGHLATFHFDGPNCTAVFEDLTRVEP